MVIEQKQLNLNNMSTDEMRVPSTESIPTNRGWLSMPQAENGKKNESYPLNLKKSKNLSKTDKENNKHIRPLLNTKPDKILEPFNNNEWNTVENFINNNDNIKTEEQKINNNNSVNNDCVYGYEQKSIALQDVTEEESTCGIGSCQPVMFENLASTNIFMVVFLIAWVLQGMYYTYFVSVITTIEKLFQIKSKTTGMLMSATEIGQISTSLFLTYYAGRGHRPRWIACGMIVFAFASFSCTLPHFIFGDQLLHATNVLNGGLVKQEYSLTSGLLLHNSTILNDKSDLKMNLCYTAKNGTNHSDQDCGDVMLSEQEAHSQLTYVVLLIFFISLLGVGVGQTAVSTLGIPYIDDNVASRESPIYLAITIGVRILGPAAGFILGSFCTRLFVNVSEDPGFGPSDPRWVGAWWLGLVLISSCMVVASLAMFMFPKHLKGSKIAKQKPLPNADPEEKMLIEQTPKIKDFPRTIKRQLSNDILMCRTASSVLHLLPVAGLYTFLPKYMESQFRLTAHDANLISGTGGILVMGVGIVISGIVILKFNPSARTIAAWIAFTALIYSTGMAILMFIGCPTTDLIGIKNINEHQTQLYQPLCNSTCSCDTEKFSPICGSDGLTYFSSCHAGCSNANNDNGTFHYYDCDCITSNSLYPQPEAVGGYCGGTCTNFIWFISLFSFFVFMHSTSEVGSMLLIMRCTDPKDKAMAMGIIQFAIGLFGNVPCPIIYGSVVDSACLVWETICGKQGACSLYNRDTFRFFFLGTTAGIMFLAFCMDLIVWHKAHRIDIDPESSLDKVEKPIDSPESTV